MRKGGVLVCCVLGFGMTHYTNEGVKKESRIDDSSTYSSSVNIKLDIDDKVDNAEG